MSEQTKTSISLTRAELYDLIWAEPMSKVAARLNILSPKLAEICSAYAIARPDNGHWLRLEMGKPLRIHALQPAPDGVPETINICPRVRRADAPSASSATVPGDKYGAVTKAAVPERLVKPHALVAEWIALRQQQVRKGEQVYDHGLKRLVRPTPLTGPDRRRLLVANTLFKAVEKQGVEIVRGERRELLMKRGGEQIEFQLRYRLKRGKRQLTAEELRWRGPGAQTWAYELYETDSLVFEIKTWLPRGTRTEWEDSQRGSIEQLLGEIIDGIMAAFPALEELRRERDAEQRRNEATARERREREEARKLDAARFRRLLELAEAWRDSELLRAFVAALRRHLPVEDRTEVSEWLAWADRKIEEHDRMANDPGSILASIAEVTPWTYRD